MNNREVAEKTLEVLNKKLHNNITCPFCSSNSWIVSDQISLTGTINMENNSVNPGSGMPGVNIICRNCGYTASFNPKALGIV